LRGPRIDQLDRLFLGHVLGLQVARQGGVGGAVGDVRAITAGHYLDLAAAGRVGAEGLDRLSLGPPARAAAIGRFCEQRDGGVHSRLEYLARAAQLGVLAVVREVGAIAADARGDRLAGFWVLAHFARQAQQLQRPLEVEIGQVLGDRGALRVLALAELDIRPEAARAARDGEPALGIGAHRAIVLLAVLGGLAELPAEVAFGIVRAGDEGAEAAPAQRQAPAFAMLRDTLGA